MNKKFNDDTPVSFNYKYTENTIRKFFQSTISYINERPVLQKGLFYDYPENYDLRYEFSALDSSLKTLLSILETAYLEEDFYIFVCLLVSNHDHLPDGVYYFNFTDGDILRFKLFDNKLKSLIDAGEFVYGVSFFVDLKNAVLMDEARGFIKGLTQIGSVMERIGCALGDEYKILIKYPNPNILTHALGINLANQLLISSMYLSSRSGNNAVHK